MGPHGICMRFVYRNMLTLSLSLSIGVAEATPRQQRRFPAVRRSSSGETLTCFMRSARWSPSSRIARSFTSECTDVGYPVSRVDAAITWDKAFLAGAK